MVSVEKIAKQLQSECFVNTVSLYMLEAFLSCVRTRGAPWVARPYGQYRIPVSPLDEIFETFRCYNRIGLHATLSYETFIGATFDCFYCCNSYRYGFDFDGRVRVGFGLGYSFSFSHRVRNMK